MIKLKPFVKEQGEPVQPSNKNPFEPATTPTAQPVQKVSKVAPKPVSTSKQPVGEEGKIQQQIFSIKIRLNQLAMNTVVKKFQMTLQSFKSKVTRNTTDKSLIQKYLAPLMGDVESLKGNLESLESELQKLDDMAKVEEK